MPWTKRQKSHVKRQRSPARNYTEYDIFTVEEVTAVIDRVKAAIGRKPTLHTSLIVFELAICGGLRASEICKLRVEHIHQAIQRPHLELAGDITKKHRHRRVPLTWTPWLLGDLCEWLVVRESIKGSPLEDNDLVVVTMKKKSHPPTGRTPGVARVCYGNKLDRVQVRRHFIRACRGIDLSGRKITTHTGRHTFASHALAAGISPAAVRDALGHSSLAVTDLYAHAVDSTLYDMTVFRPAKDPSSPTYTGIVYQPKGKEAGDGPKHPPAEQTGSIAAGAAPSSPGSSGEEGKCGDSPPDENQVPTSAKDSLPPGRAA